MPILLYLITDGFASCYFSDLWLANASCSIWLVLHQLECFIIVLDFGYRDLFDTSCIGSPMFCKYSLGGSLDVSITGWNQWLSAVHHHASQNQFFNCREQVKERLDSVFVPAPIKQSTRYLELHDLLKVFKKFRMILHLFPPAGPGSVGWEVKNILRKVEVCWAISKSRTRKG